MFVYFTCNMAGCHVLCLYTVRDVTWWGVLIDDRVRGVEQKENITRLAQKHVMRPLHNYHMIYHIHSS